MQEVPKELAEAKAAPPSAEPTVELSDEQKNILKLVKSGRNIFFTGPAGDAMPRIVHEGQCVDHHLQVLESRFYSEP